MKTGVCWSMGLLLLAVGSTRTTAAVRHATGRAPVQIVWLRPERVPAERRIALSRLLVNAARGLALRGVEVRDSRPEPAVVDLAGCGSLDRLRNDAAPGRK